MNNTERENTDCASVTNRDLVLPRQELEQNSLQTENTPANNISKPKATKSKRRKRRKSMWTRNSKNNRKVSNFVQAHDENGENNSGEKTDIIVTNFAYNTTLESQISESDEDCVIVDCFPFQRRMRTRSMGRIKHIPWRVNHQFTPKNAYEKKHMIEVKEETIFQQNLQMTTHFYSKSDTFSCNLHDNNSSIERTIKGNRKRQRDLHCSRGERHQGLTSQVQKRGNIAETILQNNLQHLVDSNLKNNCDISMRVNKTNEYKVNKSLKIDNSKMNVHNSIKKKEIIESECHIEIRKKGQDDLLKKCERNAIKTTKKTFVSKTIKQRKSIKSFKAVTEKHKNKGMVNQYSRKKELIIPLVKLEDLSLAKLVELLHIPRNIENKIEMLQKKESQYTVRNTSTEECTIIHKQYKVTQIEKNGELDRQDERNFCENREESTSSAQQINGNLEDDVIISLDQRIAKRLMEHMEKDNSGTLSSLDTKEYFTKCQQVAENEHLLKESQESLLNEEHTHPNETILEESNAEIESSNLEIEHNVSDNEVSTGEMLENHDSELQANILLQNVYKFYLKNKIKTKDMKVIERFMKEKENKSEIPRKVAICSKCKQVINLLQQFSEKTNFMTDQKIQIECTLCNVHIYSLSHFQQHLMDTHLQCEQKFRKETKRKYSVEIIHFNIQNSNGVRPLYECCCCFKAFKQLGNFKRHVTYVHYVHPICQYPPETFSTKYVAASLETNVLNKNLITETVDNTAEFLNGVEDSTNVLNNANLNVNTEESQVETNEMELGQNKALECSNINSTNNQSNQKQSKKNRETSLYRCKDCGTAYKRKHFFLSHVSKHSANSDNFKKSEKTSQEILDNDPSKVENNVRLLYDRYNNVLPPVALKEELQKANCNRTTKETILENFKHSDHDNTNKEKVLENKNTFDFHCMLHVNCTRTIRTGEKRQQFIKCNVNVSKKLKTDSTVQQTLKNKSKDNLFINYVDQPNFTFNGDMRAVSYEQEKIQCKICNIKFNSQQILKEHMLLHDSILEDREVLNLLYQSHNDNNNAEESVSTEDEDENSRNEDNIPTGEEEVTMYENVICEMLNDCSINKRNKKWRCNLCKENFALIRNYLRHKYYIHNDVTVVHVCDNCKKVLTSVAMVNIHKCINVTSWSCRRCNLEFVNGTYLAQHNINDHFEIAGPHTCDVCETSFLTQYMLEKHRPVHSLTNNCNNVDNFIDATVCSQNDLPYNLDGEYSKTESDAEEDSNDNNENTFEYVSENDKSSGSVNEDRTGLNRPAKVANIFSKKFSSSSILLESDIEEMFKCKICDVVCRTRKQMKSHLENWHETNAEACKLCNRLYIANKLIEHLMDCHIVTSDFNSKGNNIDAQLDYNRAEDFQENVVDRLGLKRLITLYEYQRFKSSKKKGINCMMCPMQFVNTQSYRLHYLKFHDRVCLLCNIEFKDQYQAFEHKIKIHMSVSSYLWVVEKLIASILEFNENGITLENVILQYSEKRMQDVTRSPPEMLSLNNDNNEELNDKECCHTVQNTTSFI